MKNYSIWEEIEGINFDELKDDINVDVLIVGGGITGILCAYELKKRNINCLIVEKNKIGGGISKNTTAFLSVKHDILYQDLIKNKGINKALEYLNLNKNAIDEYEKISQKYDIDFKRCDSIFYSCNDEEKILNEKNALDKLGYNTKLVDEIKLPIKIKKGLKFFNQATIHPLKCIYSLAKELNIYENTEIVNIKNNCAYTKNNKIEFKKIIIATHFPCINKRGLYFMKMHQRRSYVALIKYDKKINNTYCSIDDNGMYFRGYNDYLIMGGNDRDTKEICQRSFLNRSYELFHKDIEYSYSNQDCITLDQIPYIGFYSRFNKDYLVATGFNMWGYTWAMAASFIIADIICGKKKNELVDPLRITINTKLFSNIGNSIVNLVKLKKLRCSHLGCTLNYNKIDNVYECPCHGSRFNMNGEVIDGPACIKIKIK